MINKQKLTIGLTVFVDVFGLGIIIPVLPIFLHDMIQSPFWIEMFFTIYALCGFVAAPILGALSDRFGRRPILILSIAGTAIGWWIFSLGSSSIIFLVIGRIIDGITSGNISTAQSYLIDISKDAKERTANLGMIGAIFGIAFITGPAIGGLLSKISLMTPFFITSVLATINAISAYFFLPETNLNRDHSRKISFNPFKDMTSAFADTRIRLLLIVWGIYTLCFGLVQSVFSLYGHLAFDFSATTNGVLMAVSGLVIALNQGFLLKKVWLKYFPEKLLSIGSTIALGIAYLFMAVHSIFFLVIGLILSSFGQSLTRVLNNSAVSHLAPPHKVGQMMGVLQSIMFFTAILSPILGGIALEYSLILPWFISAGLMLVAFVLLRIEYIQLKKAHMEI